MGWGGASGVCLPLPTWKCHRGGITSGQAELTIQLPDGHSFELPNRLNRGTINHVGAEGDLKSQCVSFERSQPTTPNPEQRQLPLQGQQTEKKKEANYRIKVSENI